MKLILVRHGESVGNLENRLQGHNDYELTELGRRQASLTGARLAALNATAVYTSPLLRAAATARTIGESLGVAPQVDSDLSEYHFGELAGATYADLRRRFGGPPPGSAQPTERVYPGEEGRENFFRRVTESIWGMIERHPGESVAVVSHGGPIALFCQTVLGLPYTRPMPFAIGNCSLTTIEVVEGRPANQAPKVLAQLNDTCHLKALATEWEDFG